VRNLKNGEGRRPSEHSLSDKREKGLIQRKIRRAGLTAEVGKDPLRASKENGKQGGVFIALSIKRTGGRGKIGNTGLKRDPINKVQVIKTGAELKRLIRKETKKSLVGQVLHGYKVEKVQRSKAMNRVGII